MQSYRHISAAEAEAMMVARRAERRLIVRETARLVALVAACIVAVIFRHKAGRSLTLALSQDGRGDKRKKR